MDCLAQLLFRQIAWGSHKEMSPYPLGSIFFALALNLILLEDNVLFTSPNILHTTKYPTYPHRASLVSQEYKYWGG